MARSIGGSRRRRCVCGLACLGRSPFCSRQRCAQPHPHAACGHTGESAEHDARHRRLLGRLASAGAQLVGTSLPRGREPESHSRLAEREPERPGATGLRLAPPACAGCHESARAPPHEPACTADAPCAPTLSGGDMGVARGGIVLAAPVRLAAPRFYCPRAERRQHHRLRAMQIRRACPRAHLPCRRAALRTAALPLRRPPAALPPPRRPDIHSYACRPRCVPQMRGRRSPVR